ncbi:MAG: hypothetical protein RMM17_11630 [Acidobacteriota bacterium]|nr:hypothetical protein [Blastocatellia bacterium]MDW8413323.1 hypothetical protein [Acidobacteriota bacterium]
MLFLLLLLQTSSMLERVSDIMILRSIYPNEPIVSETSDGQSGQRYQIGELPGTTAYVYSRTEGNFVDVSKKSLLAIVVVDSVKTKPLSTGQYTVLITLDEYGNPRRGMLCKALSRNSTTARLKICTTTDVDFDKLQDVIVLETNPAASFASYHIYRWNGEDFEGLSEHPAEVPLKLLANLDLAARRSVLGRRFDDKITAAYDTYSQRMQLTQSPEELTARIKDSLGVQLDSLKVMIKGPNSALVRAEYSYLVVGGSKRSFQSDYQIRLYEGEWKIDAERVKALTD